MSLRLMGFRSAVPPGQVFGFLGPNGAGKTTAMRAVFGLVALDGGEVRWCGGPIGERERRRFGYMPEERGLYPGMRIFDQLVFLGRLHGLQEGPHARPRCSGPSVSALWDAVRTGLRRCRMETNSGFSLQRAWCTHPSC